MDKILVRQHLNTLSLVMNHLADDIRVKEEIVQHYSNKGITSEEFLEALAVENHYIYTLKEALCDLDTIRQEYQKELDK